MKQQLYKAVYGLHFYRSTDREKMVKELPVLNKEELLETLYHEHEQGYYTIMGIYDLDGIILFVYDDIISDMSKEEYIKYIEKFSSKGN